MVSSQAYLFRDGVVAHTRATTYFLTTSNILTSTEALPTQGLSLQSLLIVTMYVGCKMNSVLAKSNVFFYLVCRLTLVTHQVEKKLHTK